MTGFVKAMETGKRKMQLQEVLDNVPDEQVEKIVQGFMSDGASVKKERQPDGTWRITATFDAKTKSQMFAV